MPTGLLFLFGRLVTGQCPLCALVCVWNQPAVAVPIRLPSALSREVPFAFLSFQVKPVQISSIVSPAFPGHAKDSTAVPARVLLKIA